MNTTIFKILSFSLVLPLFKLESEGASPGTSPIKIELILSSLSGLEYGHNFIERRSLSLMDDLSHISSPRLTIKAFHEVPEDRYIIEFANAESRITKASLATIKIVAKKILSIGASQVLIEGHADQKGNPEYNLRLSRRRSESVLRALTDENISPSILKIDWKGEFDPSVPAGENDSEPRNRRVVIYVFW